jgi:hypothetical protein
MKTKLAIIGVMIMLTSCGNKLEVYKGTSPKADIKEYFNGNIKAWGLVQDWRGNVTTRFDVDMVGSWEGNKGTLKEDFRYYDGKTQQRVWHITKHDDGTYTGTAGDIIGIADGKLEGSAVNWSYTMDIPVDNKTYRIKLDDWMWQMNDGILINRSYLKKFGITVAELTLFMQKQE